MTDYTVLILSLTLTLTLTLNFETHWFKLHVGTMWFTSCVISGKLFLSHVSFSVADFGTRFLKDIPSDYVVGGEEAQPNAWPWQVRFSSLFPFVHSLNDDDDDATVYIPFQHTRTQALSMTHSTESAPQLNILELCQ